MSDSRYRKIEFPLGSTVDDAVNELLNYKRKGLLVYGVFNGVTLYSDTVTMDSAYKAITGKTKFKFDVYVQEFLRGGGFK